MTNDLHDLERDIEQSRAKLDLTIDRLQDKMTLSGVVDDMLGTARAGRYAPLFDNVLLTIRRNPVPVMLVAAGIGLLAYRLTRPQPMPRRTMRLATDADLVAEPVETRVYPGASTLETPEDAFETQRTMNSRI